MSMGPPTAVKRSKILRFRKNRVDAQEGILTSIGAAVPAILPFIAGISVLLGAAVKIGLSEAQTASWLLVSWGIPGVLTITFALTTRQPLLFTGNIFALIFVSSLGDRLTYPEIVFAFTIAGIGVAFVGVTGISRTVSRWIPASVVMGLLAGAILPYISGIFNSMGANPLLIGGTFIVYVLSRRFIGSRISAILPALVTGLIIAGLTSQFGKLPETVQFPRPVFAMPEYSLEALTTAVPVLLILIVLQSNIPSVIFLKNEGYRPPDKLVSGVGGLVTAAGSLLGPAAISLSLPATSLVASKQAGEPSVRFRVACTVGAAMLVVALLSSVATLLPMLVPTALLLSVAGLAMVDVLIDALRKSIVEPLPLGSLFAFVIAASDIELFGFGRFFWALVIGTLVYHVFRRTTIRRENRSG